MHKSRLGALVIDCQSDDLTEQTNFWSAALGSKPEDPAAQINSKYTRLDAVDGEPRILLQQVDHPSRVHFDIETDNIEAEVKRLRSLGATVIEKMEKWVVMEAPSKHRFCVISPIRSDFETHANIWE